MLRKHLHLASARPRLVSGPSQHVAQFRAGIILSGVGLSCHYKAGVGAPGSIATALPDPQPLTWPLPGPGFPRSELSLSCAGETFFGGDRHS